MKSGNGSMATRNMAGGAGQGDSIRERQRRRREAARQRGGIEAILSSGAVQDKPEDEDEEEDVQEEQSSGPPPSRVFVLFQGTKWTDPAGGLRESDAILGVYGSEEAARREAALRNREAPDGTEAWYQPYAVQE